MTKLISLLVAATLFAPAISAQTTNPNKFRVLVPIYISQPIPGAGGSLWESELTMYNPTSRSFFSETCVPPDGEGCGLRLDPASEIRPGETERGLAPRYMENVMPSNGGGAVLHLTKYGPEPTTDFAFQLKVRDRSRNARSAGTELPVVRDTDFRTRAIHLLDVPTDIRFRLMLRIYDMNLDEADFIVRIVDATSPTSSWSYEIPVRARSGRTEIPGYEYRYIPAYAQLTDLVPTMMDPYRPSRVRIEIEPRSPGSAFWAFISVTNNETQEFTTVTPQ